MVMTEYLMKPLNYLQIFLNDEIDKDIINEVLKNLYETNFLKMLKSLSKKIFFNYVVATLLLKILSTKA